MQTSTISKLLVAAGFTAVAPVASAAIAIDFNAAFSGGVSSNLADSDSVAKNNLVYGILVDTAATPNGFLSAYESGFALTRGSLISLSNDVGLSSDDQLFISGGQSNTYLTSDTSVLTEGDFFTTGGTGGIVSLSDIPDSAAGKPFAVIWFESSQSVDTTVVDGTNFGILTDPSFVLGSPGTPTTYDAPFVGVDPIRPATDGVFQMIPEPSTFLLTIFGALGLLRRRR